MFWRSIGIFLVGVYVGQEYPQFPKIKEKATQCYDYVKKTDIYKTFKEDESKRDVVQKGLFF